VTVAFEAFELDIPICRRQWKATNSFGVCAATGDTPCFNTRETTQSPEDYDPAPVTLRFAKPSGFLPDDIEAFPTLLSVDYSPATIAPGKSLGERARVTFILRDHQWGDTGPGFDKYRTSRPYNPATQGTFWSKLRARHRSLRNCQARWINGSVGQPIGEMETRHFVVESIDGPRRDGTFAIVAQDVLKLADGDRSQTPPVTNGALSADIAANATSFNVTLPAGFSLAQYPTSNFYVNVGGNEVILCTSRSGGSFNISGGRGRFGTTASAHSAGDRVQLCRYYSAQPPSVIMSDILINDCGMDPTQIPLAEWEEEEETYLNRLFTRCIAEPQSSKQVLDGFIEQAGLTVWPDELARAVRMQVLRGVPSDAVVYATDMNIKRLTVKDQPETRISRAITRFAQRTPLLSPSEPQSFRSARIRVDVDAELIYGSPAIREIPGTWIPPLGDTTADRTNELQVGRFSTPPRRFTFTVEKGAQVKPVMGMGARLRCPEIIQDATGAVADTPVQITRVRPQPYGFDVEAEEMLVKLFDPQDITNRVILINASSTNLNLLAIHNSLYPKLTAADVTNGVNVTVIVSAGVTVNSGSTALPAIDIPTGWPPGLPFTLDVYGRILGRGGNARTGVSGGFVVGSTGYAGGPALRVRIPIILHARSGSRIWSGGGGGGTGGGAAELRQLAGQFTNPLRAGNGGAGQGTPNGSSGAETAGQAGGAYGSRAGDGGPGGAPGQSGSTGQTGRTWDLLNSRFLTRVGGPGGVAGAQIDGISFVTVSTNLGDRRGPTIN
jgi:hypothetical protein